MTNNAIPQETEERLFSDITILQLDLPVDLETPTAHITTCWTEHFWYD